jgi:hypothetical protein
MVDVESRGMLLGKRSTTDLGSDASAFGGYRELSVAPTHIVVV